jgi:hypothetical protein
VKCAKTERSSVQGVTVGQEMSQCCEVRLNREVKCSGGHIVSGNESVL